MNTLRSCPIGTCHACDALRTAAQQARCPNQPDHVRDYQTPAFIASGVALLASTALFAVAPSGAWTVAGSVLWLVALVCFVEALGAF